MANPGEEMVCGQCGQTILGKAMKVIVSSSSCASINMLIIISTFQVRQKKSILRLTWKRRLVRNIGTNITSSAATAEWGSEETAKWGKLSSSKNQIEENYLHLYQSSKASKYQRIKEEKWPKSSPPKRGSAVLRPRLQLPWPWPFLCHWSEPFLSPSERHLLNPPGVAKRGPAVLRLGLQEEVRPKMRRLQWIHTWGLHHNKIYFYSCSIVVAIYIYPISIYLCYIIVAILYPGYITLLQECIRAVGETWHPEHFSCFVSFYFTIAHLLQDKF